MKYIDEDLDFIFIRAKNKQGEWDNISIRNLDRKQWEKWLRDRFGDGKQFWAGEGGEWSDGEKLNMLNWLAKRGARFVMIKRGKIRQNWNKK